MVNMHSFTVSIPREGNAAISIQKFCFKHRKKRSVWGCCLQLFYQNCKWDTKPIKVCLVQTWWIIITCKFTFSSKPGERWLDGTAHVFTLLKHEVLLFSEFWKNRNESNNFHQRHEVELIKEEKRKIVELEVRLKVRQTKLWTALPK